MTDGRRYTYFLSDLHLGASYLGDRHEAERRVVRFLDSIAGSAREIYLVGDVLDYWFEYRYVVPRGFVRFFGKLAELADSGVRITWLAGNHDIWMFGYFAEEMGVQVADGHLTRTIDGKKFLIAHGDDVSDPSRSFRFLRSLFRNKVCQRLYAAVHPRWTIPFALGWSRHSREADGDSGRPDGKPLVEFARKYLVTNPDIDHFIFGHLHIERQIVLPGGADLTILGDWISTFTYARFDGEKVSLLRYLQ